MNELKPCPFCGDEAETFEFEEGPALARTRLQIECSNASDDCPMAVCSASFETMAEAATAWNTRAAPTMKKWEWIESKSHGPAWKCEAFKALTYLAAGEWHVYIDMIFVGSVVASVQDAPELAKAAGVAYVEGKMKEWLI